MNTKTNKIQLKNRQDRACRIELADLGLNLNCAKSVSAALVGVVSGSGDLWVSFQRFQETELINGQHQKQSIRLWLYASVGACLAPRDRPYSATCESCHTYYPILDK